MKFYYKDGIVKFISEGKVDTTLEVLEYTPTKEEQELIKQNYLLSIKDNKLVFDKPKYIIDAEETQVVDEKLLQIEALKLNIAKETTVAGLKTKITELLEIIKI